MDEALNRESSVLLLEVGRAISAKNADTVRSAIAQLQTLLDTLKQAEDAEETAEGEQAVKEAASPGHGPMTGAHSHSHPAYGAQGDDMTHSHQHSHDGDAVHQHDHADIPAAENKTPTLSEATDPNVGGGVNRDKIPAADFAGKNRSFPIVSPKDVADAAASIGRAGADNYSADELKSRIIAIAKRKGAAFEAQLPDAWKAAPAKESAESEDAQLQEVQLLEYAPLVGGQS